jgi:GNAT superfamily N-acetyltransferase
MEGALQQWGAERIEELTALVGAAAPEDDLTADELLTALYDQPGVVLALDGGSGVVAVGVGRDGSLVAVHPDHRRAGVGWALLEAAEGWAADRGAERIELGGLLAFPLWPGVDPASGLVSLAGRRGYVDVGELRAFAVPATFRAPEPVGVTVRRAVHDADVTAVNLAVASNWPRRSDEVARALDHGTCHAAFVASPTHLEGRGGEVVGIGCHSITRATWVGPLVVRTEDRRRGVGHALLGQVCRDLMIADFGHAEVPGIAEGDVAAEAFLVAAGASATRSYRTMARSLGT